MVMDMGVRANQRLCLCVRLRFLCLRFRRPLDEDEDELDDEELDDEELDDEELEEDEGTLETATTCDASERTVTGGGA